MLAFPAYGCDESNSPTGPSATAVTFTGRIVDFVTQAPIAEAAVQYTLEPDQPGPSETTTSADGQYVLTVPRTGFYTVRVGGVFAGVARINGRAYRGDVFISRGTCISRYGLVIDGRTLQPVGGATVALTGRTTTTGADGWYRIDLGCPEVLQPGGTTEIAVAHPDYERRTQVVGRGVYDVLRLDLDLERRQ